MKPDIAKRWAEALRSGEYKQGRGCLRSNNGLCCLGVLCDIVKDDVGGEWAPLYDPDDNYEVARGFCVAGEIADDILPESVRQFVGMQTSLGGFYAQGEPIILITLVNLNDSGAYDFDEIADVIEANAEKL